MSKSTFYTSIGYKVLMALSGLFLMFFLLQHLVINSLSVISPDAFNEASHFMGTNPLVQFLLQPVLIFGVVFHFIMGFFLDLKNRKSRAINYAYNKPSANSSWVSRNMIISGLTILAFLGLHFVDFWIPEINVKYIQGDMSGLMNNGEFRYYHELHEKFNALPKVIAYVIAFVFLSLHLLHGFHSSFQSIGISTSKTRLAFYKFGNIFALVVPIGFIIIALFHFIIQH
ncbi:MAG: succinate dehydrogenase [Crocinitomicaceae bacterium]|nr:succinate dehydrogenase [Crocinitomicaceae bacterium]|tara:strand:+ start:114 stop:797 length:684 start_codon:yes stop_codon:yes gene_type:complete